MKKKILTTLFILATAPLLVQCATKGDINTLNYQLRIVNQKIDDMKVGTVGQMQKNQAASSSQLDEMRKEILVLKGQLEESAHLNTLLREQNKELETSFQLYTQKVELEQQKAIEDFKTRDQQKSEKLIELDQKLSRNEEVIKAIQDARLRDAEKRAQAAAVAAEEAKAKALASSRALATSQDTGVSNISAEKVKIVYKETPPTSAAQPVVTQIEKQASVPLPSVTADDNQFSRAEQEFANGNFKEAYSHYEQFAEQNKGEEKYIPALFMMGESLFHQKEYDQAILQYQKIISTNPNHPRAASALLKQGMSFEMITDFETAKIIYKKIATTYPASPEAATATARSAKIN